MKRRVAVFVLLILFAAAAIFFWQRSGGSRPDAVSASRPDVVLITIDTLRADRVGRGLTPNLDRLATRGTVYTNVRATAPLTLPSHVSIMTGTPPYAHGVRENGVVFDRKTQTLARTFKHAGYRTGAFVGAYVLNRRFGLDDGFETYDDAVRRDMERAEQLEAERPAGEVVDAALRWLSGTHGPFFLWVHVYDPHVPYAPPREFLQKAGGNAYDGEIAYADAEIGRLLNSIAERENADRTVIALTGDHGEALGEHGEQTHGMLAYDSTLRVPLILAGGGTSHEEDARPRSLVDLRPLLLHAAGLDTVARPASHVYAESRYPRRVGWHPLSVLADEQWKLIVSSERELYDLRNDPAEQRNVTSEHPQVVEAMAAAVRTLTAGRAERDARVTPEAAERLRALGYVSGSSAVTADDPKAPNPARAISAWTEFERILGEMQAGRTRAVLPALENLALKNPNAPVFQSTYAQALKDVGRAREAVAVYKAAVRKWPADAILFHDLAVAAREAGDAGEAARAEQAALALDDTSATALNGLGLLHADAGRAQEAAGAFEKAARLDPSNPSYWTNLGNARRAMNDAAGAESAYRKALEADASFPDALNGLGTLLVQSRRAADAVPLFQRALARDPELHEARLNLGIAYQESGQREKAAETYREVLKKTPPRFARERTAAGELLKTLRRP